MNQTTLWKLPQLPAIEFFKAHLTDFSYDAHFHEVYAIAVIEDGVQAFYYRRENHFIPSRYAITYQPGEIHTGHSGSDSPLRFRTLYLHPTLVHQVAHELGYHSNDLPFLSKISINYPPLVEAIRKLHHHSEADEPPLSQEVQMHDVLTLMLRQCSDILLNPNALSNEKAPVARAKEYIQSHYSDDIQLDELARVAHLSKSYLIRAFRHHEGISPYAYLVQVRLNRAKTLLENGHSATDVAHETGFFDQSHLNRYFKRFMGMTPGRYQQAIG